MAQNILYNFRPYEWYDVSLYPEHVKLSAYEGAPLVSLMVKYYSEADDKFHYYKVKETSYHHGYENKGWNTPSGHRPIAFMWDGGDLPCWDAKYDRPPSDAPTTHPVLRDRGISQERRTIKYCVGSSGECVWQEPYEESAEVPRITALVNHPNTGDTYVIEGLNTLDRNNPVVYIRPAIIRNDPND